MISVFNLKLLTYQKDRRGSLREDVVVVIRDLPIQECFLHPCSRRRLTNPTTLTETRVPL